MIEQLGKAGWHGVWMITLVLGGCAARPEPAPSTPPVALQWQGCDNAEFADWFTTNPPPPDLQCGYLSAPLAYDGSLPGRTVRLAVTRLPATGGKGGSLLMVNGGPGMGGIDLPMSLSEPASTALRRSFDLIGYDPRGVGRSLPAIRCEGKEQSSFLNDRNRIASRMRQAQGETEIEARDFILDCIEYTGADVLQHIGTREAVQDLEVLRTALAVPRLDILAFSYGTQVAALYAERYPDKVRAMVLDGVVDLSETPAMVMMSQRNGYQQAFEAFADCCAQIRGCPLSANPAKALEQYRSLLDKLRRYPLPLPDEQQLTAKDVREVIHSELLWSEGWPALAQGLAEVARGKSGIMAELLNQQRPSYADALTVINCADEGAGSSDRRLLKRQVRQLNAAAPFMALDTARDTSDPEALSECYFWPWPGTTVAHVPVVSPALPPPLFVAQRYDPTTPYLNAQRMAAYFNGWLLTRETLGHTLALSGMDDCIDAAVLDYLAEPAKEREKQYCQVPFE